MSEVRRSVRLPASAARVWATIGGFNAMPEWHPAVERSELSNGGQTRTLHLAGGGRIVEGLDDYKEGEKFYAYRLSTENIEALPVSFYSATITVKPAGEGSEVEWIGRFYRGDTSNFPPENLNDEAAVKAMTEFFKQGLAGLKAKVESK